MNSSAFDYVELSEVLITRVTDEVIKGNSIVVLGHRNVGKQQLVNSVVGRAAAEGIGPIVKVNFLRDKPFTCPHEVKQLLWHQAVSSDPRLRTTGWPESEGILSPLSQLNSLADRPVILAASNVDTMYHSVARMFLKEIRPLVDDHSLIVIMTGQHDLRDLVHGPDSEFNCTQQFMLQRIGEVEFRKMTDLYIGLLGIQFEDYAAVQDYLWKEVRGDGHLLKGVLWLMVERQRKRLSFVGPETPKSLTLAELRYEIERSPMFGMTDLSAMRMAARQIRCDSSCWPNLEELIKHGTVQLQNPGGPPDSLTLTGVAVREGGSLHFASPLMQRLTTEYFDPVRLADLFARNMEWDKAIERYEQSVTDAPEDRRQDAAARLRRPVNTEDGPDVDFVVRSLNGWFFRADSTGEVLRRFARGVRSVLGFQVSLWCIEHGKLFRLPVASDRKLFEGEQDAAEEAFGGENLLPGKPEISSGLCEYVTARVLEGVHSTRKLGLLIHNLDVHEPPRRERRDLFERLMEDFGVAYKRLLGIERTAQRLKAEAVFRRIVESIMGAMGGKILSVHEALDTACEALSKFDYARISFELVDAREESIQPVRCFPQSDLEILKQLNQPLDPSADITRIGQWVFRHQRVYRVYDAATDKLTDKGMCNKMDLKRCATVPLLHDQRVIGTLRVARKDGLLPSDEEIDDLLEFGRGMAAAIEQVKRVTMQQKTLDGIRDPVLIFDSCKRPVYANHHAELLFGIPHGWNEASGNREWREGRDLKVSYCVERAIRHGHAGEETDGLGNDPGYSAIISAGRIEDWRHQVIGAFFAAENVTYLMRAMRALDLIAEAEDINQAMRKMLEASTILKHPWARYFRDVGGQLEGVDSIGISEKDTREFRQCRLTSPRSRWVIDQGKPLAFQFLPDCRGPKHTTEHGLEVNVVTEQTNQPCLRKEPGEIWLDFPLLTRAGCLGKLVMGCEPNFRPEDFAIVERLCAWLTGLLDAFLRRDQASRVAMERAMADFSHGFDTRFKSIPLFWDRYRGFEHRFPDIKSLNAEFESEVEALEELSHGAKRKLRMVEVQATRFRLDEALSRLRCPGLSSWAVEAPAVEVFADQHLMEEMFLELISNSTIAGATRASVGIEPNGDWVTMTYRDNGPGVPPDQHDDIFKLRFTNRPAGSQRGNGHGMDYIKRIVEKHDGQIKTGGVYRDGQINGETGAEFIIRLRREMGETK